MRDWRLGEILGLDVSDLVDDVGVRRGGADRASDDGLGDGPGVSGLRRSGKLLSDRGDPVRRRKVLEPEPGSVELPPLPFLLGEDNLPACLTRCMTVRAAWIGGLNVIFGEIIGEPPVLALEPEAAFLEPLDILPFTPTPPTSRAASCSASESDADDVPDVSENMSTPSVMSCLRAVTSFVFTSTSALINSSRERFVP